MIFLLNLHCTMYIRLKQEGQNLELIQLKQLSLSTFNMQALLVIATGFLGGKWNLVLLILITYSTNKDYQNYVTVAEKAYCEIENLPDEFSATNVDTVFRKERSNREMECHLIEDTYIIICKDVSKATKVNHD